MSNVTFNNFIKAKYDECRYKHIYGSFEKFKESRIGTEFSAWVEANRNTKPDLRFITSMAKTYIKHGNRKPNEIPYILSVLQRSYDIEIPAVPGILTVEFWEGKLRK